MLTEKKVFDEVPPPEYNPEERTTRYLPWPPANYLSKMASVDAGSVTAILLEANDNDNAIAKANLLTIAANLPLENRLTIVQKAKGWIKAKHHFYNADAAKKLIETFANDGRVDPALELTGVLLEILPDPRTKVASAENLKWLSRDPETRLDEWQYGEFLKKDFQKLMVLDPQRTHDLVSQLLLDFVNLKTAHYPDHKFEDAMHVSRPSIGDHEDRRDYDHLEHLLIDAVRDTAKSVMQKNPENFAKIISDLEEKKWTVFRRIALYLLSEAPDAARDLIVQHLTDEFLFEDSSFRAEYTALAKKKFALLSPAEQNIIFDRIEKSDAPKKMISESGNEFTPEQAKEFVERWQRTKLSYFETHLSGELKRRYEELLASHGQPEPPDGTITEWYGPTSDTNAQQLIAMEPAAIIELLKSWEPKNDRFGFGSTKEGLGREIVAAIKLKPELFRDLAEDFKGLDPTYVRSYIQGLEEVARQGVALNWPAMLSLSRWVMDQPRAIPERKGGNLDQDLDWGWTRKALASLIADAANANQIPYEMRGQLWSILKPLTDDPDPIAAREKVDDDSFVNDAYTLTINTTRGESMHGVVEYALWVYRNTEKLPDGKEKVKTGFDMMPEVKEVLERHLNPEIDSSIAVRAVYGRFLPWLLLIDDPWTVSHLDEIFPPGQFDDPLYRAAWDTYMMYVPAYNRPFEVLQERYVEAIRNLGKAKRKQKRFTDRDERVAEQLMIFFWRGKLTMKDELFKLFWENADVSLRGHAISFTGRSIKNIEETPPPELIASLKEFWQSRANEAAKAMDKKEFAEEMAAFGWWFASGKFDDAWSTDQYLAALDIGTKLQSDHFVLQRLAELAKKMPLKSVKILSKLLLSKEQPQWTVIGNKNQITTILSEALRDADVVAQGEAKGLINRLAARGYTDFGELLNKG